MRWQWMFGVIWTTILVGCGSGELATYPVEGRVTFPNGEPLHGGVVEFQPVRKQMGKMISARGLIQSDGSFRMSTFKQGDGAIAGEHRVRIIPPLPPGRINSMKVPEPVIHERFERYETSSLQFTVTSDRTNKFDFTVDPP